MKNAFDSSNNLTVPNFVHLLKKLFEVGRANLDCITIIKMPPVGDVFIEVPKH